jgi:dihydrolipoamide dehydrogenase
MDKRKVDVVILGMATAGLNAYRAAKKADASAVIVDKGPLGTTCARVGCMPSKVLISAADAYHHCYQAQEFGFELMGDVAIHGERVMKRVQQMRDEFVAGVLRNIEVIPERDKLIGSAQFLDSHTVCIDDHTQVEGKAIVIATGGETFIPPVLKPAEERLLTNEEIFELQTIPESLFVVGMGFIGMELGQAFSRLGTRVILLDLIRVVSGLTDPVVLEAAFDIFQRELKLHAPAHIIAVKKVKDGLQITYETENGQSQREIAQYILCAAGRPPQIRGLNLEKTGLPLDNHGLPPFDFETGQCAKSHIFMAGDVTGEKQSLHEAIDEGKIAGTNAARYPDVTSFKRKTPFAVVYTDPQIVIFGKRFKDFGEQGPAFVGTIDYDIQDRSRILNVNRGLGHLYIDKAGTLLGGELIGPRVEHTGHLLAWCAQQGLTVNEMLDMPFYHPSFEEGIKDALVELQNEIGLTG